MTYLVVPNYYFLLKIFQIVINKCSCVPVLIHVDKCLKLLNI